jgi:hypothetical protein
MERPCAGCPFEEFCYFDQLSWLCLDGVYEGLFSACEQTAAFKGRGIHAVFVEGLSVRITRGHGFVLRR